MTERAKIVDKAFWMAQTNAPDIYTKGRVRLAAAIREIVNEYQYHHFGEGEDMVVDARVLYELADEVEAL
jgi:hypothetical protein